MQTLSRKTVPAGVYLTVAYLCLVSGVGKLIHDDVAFFPELAALAYGIFTRSARPWLMAPLMVVTTPTATAAWGVFVASHLSYGIPAAMLCIIGSILIVKILRSPVFPAVPAGFLPLVFGIADVRYVVSIAVGTGFLVLISEALRGWRPDIDRPASVQAPEPPTARTQAIHWIAFSGTLLVACLLAVYTNRRLIFFPPLIVVAYEMLVRAKACPWSQSYASILVLCTTAALLGWASVALFGTGPLSVFFALGASIALIRAARMLLLPALAISVIPQIMPHTDWSYPLAIGVGVFVVVVMASALNTVERLRSRSLGNSFVR